MLSQPQPREILRAAIAERDECQRRIDTAITALARADDLVRDTESCLAGYVDVDEAITSHGVNEVKAWANSGGGQPKLDAPASLLERRKERDVVQEKVAAAKAARAALADEAEAAKSVQAEANTAVTEAARAVMFEEAVTIAVRLEAAKRKEWILAGQLRGLAALWLPTTNDQSVRPVRLPQQIADVLAQHEPEYPPSERPELRHAETWRTFYRSLLADYEATIVDAL